jgi:predicted DNA-binding transcriptional regulator YafY
MSRTSRLLTLLQALRRRDRPVTAAALAAELEVSVRTVYRDIAELAAQGAPIEGEAGLGYILRPGLFLPPLMLDADEVEALVLGLRYVEQRGDDVLAFAAGDVLAKIADILPPEARDVLENPMSLPGPDGWGFPANAVDLDFLRDAINGQRKLRIAYRDQQGEASRRVIWPVALGFLNKARIVAAWCELRQGWRTFRTDRIAAAEPTGDRYNGRRGVLLAEYRRHLNRSDNIKLDADKN